MLELHVLRGEEHRPCGMRIVEWKPRHARLLAELWNVSDRAWPAGLVRGRPKTVGEAREWERRSDTLARYMALEGTRPVGYVRLLPWWESPDGTYVQWLNVHPRYHGKGIGKALLVKAIEKTIDLGQPRVDLHTWPGNERAMPLYKLTGFKWVPGSHAYLQNFIPLVLSYGPARSFFTKHAWIDTLDRDLERDEDEDELHGADVFVYRFRAGRDRMEVVVDRNAREVTAFEDNDVRVEAWIPHGSLVEALEGEIRWSVRNKTRSPVSVAIEARGTEGLHAVPPAPFVLGSGKAKEVRGRVTIPDSFPDPPEDWASPFIESAVTVGGRVVRLRSGFRPKPALDMGWERYEGPMASPGTRTTLLRIRNQARRAIRGVLTVTVHNLKADRRRIPLTIRKDGIRRIRLRLENPAGQTRVGRLRLVFEAPGIRVLKNLAVPCIAPGGGVVAYAQGDTWYLATPSFRFVSKGVGAQGYIELHDGTKLLGSIWSCAGPPFLPSDSEYSRWEGRLDPARGAEIVRRFASRRKPGLVLEQRWRVLSERTLELQTALENRGNAAWTAAAAVYCDRATEHPVLTLPTARGILQDAYMESEWPDQRNDVPLGRLLAEDWIHFASDEGGCGIIWEKAEAGTKRFLELDAWTMSSWRTPEVRIPPGGRREFPPVRFVVARDWRDVREAWAHASGSRLEDRGTITGSLSFSCNPPVVVASPVAEANATLLNLRRRPIDGTASLEAAEGVKVPRERWRIRGLDLDHEWSHRIRLRGSGPAVTSARFVLEDVRSRHAWELPVLATDGRGTLRVRALADRWVVENGLMAVTVRARHGGSLTSLRSRGHEYLVTTFPRAKSFSWFRPFFGGVHPLLFEEDWPGDLYKETFRAGPARMGTWRGVALTTRAKRSSLPKGTSLRVQYLTRPGSPLLAVAMTVRNGTTLRRELSGGFWAVLGLDGKPTCEVEFDRLRPRHWRTAPWTGWTIADGGFAVYRAPGASRSVAAVAAEPGLLEVVDLRDHGRHGIVQRTFELEPGESGTLLGVLALVPHAEARAYRALRRLSVASIEATRVR